MAISKRRVFGAVLSGSGLVAMSMPFVAAGGYGAGLDLWLLLGGAAALSAGLIVLLMARKPAASGALGDGPRRPDEPPT